MISKKKKNYIKKNYIKKKYKKSKKGGEFDILSYYKINCKNSTKFIIYACSDNRICGGLCDRFKGIMLCFLIALITKRQLKISMNTGDNLEKYLIPNKIDWIFKNNKKEFINLNWMDLRLLIKKNIGCSDDEIINFFSKLPDNVYINTNVCPTFLWDDNEGDIENKICRNIRHRNNNIDLNLNHTELFKIIFNLLFKQTTFLQNEIDKVKRNIYFKNHNIITFHVRLGDYIGPNQSKKTNNITGYKYLLNEVSKLYNRITKKNNKSFMLLIVSDEDNFLKYTKQNLKNINFNLSNNFGHIDQSNKNNYLGTLIDFFLIKDSSYLIKTGGQFSKYAFKLSNNYDNIYTIKYL